MDFTIPTPAGPLSPIEQAVYDIGDALDNPVDRRGNHYDLRYLKPILAWHLPRAGIGRVDGMAVIKRRVYPNGYVDWVDVRAPDAPPDPLAGATIADLANASPEERAAAIRRLQGETNPTDLDEQVPWRVRTNIEIGEEFLT